jgi:hypothetical protein
MARLERAEISGFGRGSWQWWGTVENEEKERIT